MLQLLCPTPYLKTTKGCFARNANRSLLPTKLHLWYSTST